MRHGFFSAQVVAGLLSLAISAVVAVAVGATAGHYVSEFFSEVREAFDVIENAG